MFQFFKNGHSRDQEAEVLRERLEVIRQSIQAGDDVWRNRQRAKYLERRLRELSRTD